MWVLALDTATPDLVVGVHHTATGATFEQVHEDTRHHNEQLVPTVQDVLRCAGIEFADLGAIVVGCGPGPFTGLRVGMATASAFGQALGIPVHGVVTHDAIAAQCNGPRTLVVTDARRREIYWALYDEGACISGPDVVAPADLSIDSAVDTIAAPAHLVEALPLTAADVRNVGPTVKSLVSVADLDAQPEPLVPLYLRRPDAKEPAPKPKSPAIPEVEL
ncbi:tRNA (adenosine(37)-N6)-threonylcarbamoyltransferase complex dimerization subunit type 1 TsaB [Corynebacterium pilosum]|uniref:tRNA threonylcarbamoyladenosine biosynthesis protein Gcp n=1 Tax=Corynebacterium pilosum TaxID=35756 RepID=A0A376CMY5_9CORY|nr:tRNA (adenosine(37)-N6)-threonylcarbamoyltransferase complex dimerization subunit type 1 TsaB [Corynebacterium pilosum]STC69693.1 tRNA threonylcarbamoyladenosine biosynthesis protein Gcp [Corynebacterium pilosum]